MRFPGFLLLGWWGRDEKNCDLLKLDEFMVDIFIKKLIISII
jgi:hypothetical protein